MIGLAILALGLGPKVDMDVVYAKVGDTELKMDLHHPVSPGVGKSPAVVVIHGGAWMAGARKDIESLAKAFAEEGFLAANVSYRLAPKHKWPAMLDDVQTAVRYLRHHAGKLKIDPKMIAATGASAGGHLSLFLGFTDTREANPKEFPKESSRVQAVLDLFGPTDMSQDYPKSADILYSIVLGKPRDQAAAEIKAASPLNFVDAKSAPVYIIQGLNDAVVPSVQSVRLSEKLKKTGVVYESVMIDGFGHGPSSGTPEANAKFESSVKAGIQFVKKNLGVR